jgi:hypothetical protein
LGLLYARPLEFVALRCPPLSRQSYASDLSDERWLLLEPLLPLAVEGFGRPWEVDFREVINAIL